MGIDIQSWAWRQALNPATKLVFVKLAESANDETGECWPSLKHIANRCGMAYNTVRFHIRKLREAGLILVIPQEREDKTRTSNLYKILAPTCQDLNGYPSMDGGGTRQPIDGGAKERKESIKEKKERISEPELEPRDIYGEFHHVKLTEAEYGKLKDKLNGNLDAYIDRFDRWVEENPKKTRSRHAYPSILNWYDRDHAAGETYGKGRESHAERVVRKNKETYRALTGEDWDGPGPGSPKKPD